MITLPKIRKELLTCSLESREAQAAGRRGPAGRVPARGLGVAVALALRVGATSGPAREGQIWAISKAVNQTILGTLQTHCPTFKIDVLRQIITFQSYHSRKFV